MPPTDRIAAYEKAPGTLQNWFDVGPNRVRMRLVTRNERDGTLKYENGRGIAIQNLTAQNAPILSSAAPWLDVVQIELEPTPDRVDVIEARVLDHTTRTLISHVSSRFGWRMVSPDVLQIYGLGKLLPEKLDIWFRLQSYPANEQRIGTLAPTPKSSCRLPDRSRFTLNDIRNSLDGGWTSAKGFLASPKPDGDQVVGDFTISHGHDQLRWQLTAVLKSGERIHPDSRHFVGPGVTLNDHRDLISFDADLSDVQHFEIRPFGGRERFFFDAVTLPKVSHKPFSAPPTARVPVAGGEVEEAIAVFSPLEICVATHRGLWVGGTRSGNGRAVILPSKFVSELDRAFTITTSIHGLSVRLGSRFTLVGAKSPAAIVNVASIKYGDAVSGNSRAGAVSYRIPLDQVDNIEVELKP